MQMIPQFMKALSVIHEKTPESIAFLPSIYQEEAEKRFSPLWAFLLLMEHYFFQFRDQIERIDTYFDVDRAETTTDPKEVSTDFLGWLGTWVAFELEQSWTEERKRYAVGNASQIYKTRGTVTGLRYMLALVFGIDVEIREWTWPHAMQVGVRNAIGVDSQLNERPNLDHCFVIIWKPDLSEAGPEIKSKIKKIRALIDREKPAHTRCYFQVEGVE
jgi:phage tail-like protein